MMDAARSSETRPLLSDVRKMLYTWEFVLELQTSMESVHVYRLS